MSLVIDGTDIGQAIEIALNVGGVIAVLVIALLVYLLVRPARRQAPPPLPAEPDEVDVREMLRLLDRMEQRLEVLERAIGQDTGPRRELLEAGGEAPGTRREQ